LSRLRLAARPTPFPYTTLFRSVRCGQPPTRRRLMPCPKPAMLRAQGELQLVTKHARGQTNCRAIHCNGAVETTLGDRFGTGDLQDRKSTRLNSSHRTISYAVFC